VLDVSHRCHNACSAGAAATVAEIARRRGQRFQALGYATSDDVKPGESLNFVGYLAGVWR
jgi:AmmeMemoRadiSam system protein B